ncbi:DUF305 domain-containing protein [Agrococcus sp. BE272]|uniref:DUF305 domain-containing protein n=1 Tax=Agrococcus sp. BE272 TaxID=2817727 RepID=UPI00285A82E5|nr:DUF305 domain-containing protein [Agrococcus sp. BE272]MDR7233191.1 cation transport ATPase [Agrococcus sp. BE272]
MTHAEGQHETESSGNQTGKMYLKFGAILLVSLGVMWVLSMSMIRELGHFTFNISNFYMALIMVAAMGIVMTIGMWSMFPSKKANIAMVVGFAALFVVALLMGRSEAFVGDKGFLESMIPHHSRAILVCQESDITDPEIVQLCDDIVEAQQEEIAQMERILERY